MQALSESNFMYVSDKAKLGKNVRLGAGIRIYDNVIIGDDTVVDDYVILGYPASGDAHRGRPLIIGPGAIIRSHSVLYEGSTYGPGLEVSHHAVLREGTQAGTNLRVGNFSDIEGDCVIGDFCRFHGYVHVGQGSQIGHFVWLFSLVTLTNDPLPPSHIERPVVIEDGVVVAVGVTVLPGTVLGMGSFVAAVGRVSGHIPPASVVVEGNVKIKITRLVDLEEGIAHPWMRHFKDAYPHDVWARLEALEAQILQAAAQLSL